MQFGVPGPVQATAGGGRAAIGTGHQRTILAVLLAAGGEAVTTGRLIEALWGADVPASARKSLQSHVSRLRGALADVDPSGSEPLLTISGSHRIDDLRSAHAWLVDRGDIDGALRLSVALSDHMVYRLRDEMITWTYRAVELDHATEHPAYPAALATAAMGATHRGEYAAVGGTVR